MITRIVRLTLQPERLGDFLELFSRVQTRIHGMPGCKDVTLLQDTRYPNIVSTLSHWTDESALEAYRNTEFFRQTWSATRKLFAAPPVAESYRAISEDELSRAVT